MPEMFALKSSRDSKSPVTKSRLRSVAAACIVAAGFVLVISIFVFGLSDKAATTRDYLEYWSAEQLYVHGANPYDIAATLKMERSAGFDKSPALITLSPPVAFFFAQPLGWVGAKNGLSLWLIFLFACLLISIWLLWALHGRPDSRYHLIGIVFPPTLWCLTAGQLGIFFLLEIVLFLYLHKSRPALAGAALAFCALKPHLFLPCLLVLLLWSIHKRNFRVLAGMVCALTASCLLTMSRDWSIWTQYIQMMRSHEVVSTFSPTVSVALRLLIDRNAHWIEFVADAAACIWAAWYFWKRRSSWEWADQGLVVLAVSAACAPYSFYTDQAMLFPAVLAGLLTTRRLRRTIVLLAIVGGLGWISLMAEISLTSAFYVWTAPALLVWFLDARRGMDAAAKPELV
jgi:hypothetical protein